METIKINKISNNGYEGGIAMYDARFSPIYCLCLYVCQYVLHVNYMDKTQIEKIRQKIHLGKSLQTCFYWAGNDTTYSAIAPEGRSVLEGDFGSKFDFQSKTL